MADVDCGITENSMVIDRHLRIDPYIVGGAAADDSKQLPWYLNTQLMANLT